MFRLYCAWCSEPLTGKQRKYCSERCRNRFRRWTENDRDLPGNEPGLTANRPQMTANRPGLRFVIEIDYETNGITTERDGWVLRRVQEMTTTYVLKQLRKHNGLWSFKLISSKLDKS